MHQRASAYAAKKLPMTAPNPSPLARALRMPAASAARRWNEYRSRSRRSPHRAATVRIPAMASSATPAAAVYAASPAWEHSARLLAIQLLVPATIGRVAARTSASCQPCESPTTIPPRKVAEFWIKTALQKSTSSETVRICNKEGLNSIYSFSPIAT
jgi:hypothetical protein